MDSQPTSLNGRLTRTTGKSIRVLVQSQTVSRKCLGQVNRKIRRLKVISAVRHSGKTYHSKKLGFVDCDEVIGKELGWPQHFNKKEFSDKIYSCNHVDEHDIAVQFSKDSWNAIKNWAVENDSILSIPEVWSTRSFWEWDVKPDALVTIDEERHKQNLLEINQGHMWGTIKFWRHMLEHEAKENDICVVHSFDDAVSYMNEN